ncbi:MAG TPA: hypothetical protein VIC85_07730 [Ktedonobacterales bacterium]|jgi:hypothetical protein
MTTSATAGNESGEQAELARLESRVRRLWYDLAMAERRGQPRRVLERMYNGYVAAVDELVRHERARALERAHERARTRPRDRLAS